jgi:hypothetical protein
MRSAVRKVAIIVATAIADIAVIASAAGWLPLPLAELGWIAPDGLHRSRGRCHT